MKGMYPMSMSAMSENYQKMWSWQPRPLSSNEGLVHNRANQIASLNAKTGSHLNLRTEVAATTASMLVNIVI